MAQTKKYMAKRIVVGSVVEITVYRCAKTIFGPGSDGIWFSEEEGIVFDIVVENGKTTYYVQCPSSSLDHDKNIASYIRTEEVFGAHHSLSFTGPRYMSEEQHALITKVIW
jgi:hypothetical protein